MPVAKADAVIYIRPDGSVDPPTAPIQRIGDIYTLTGNVSGSITVEKDNIKLDGKNYILQALSGEGIGLNLHNRRNVTVENFKIVGFETSIFLLNSTGIVIFRNVMENNFYGIIIESLENKTGIQPNSNILLTQSIGKSQYIIKETNKSGKADAGI